MTINKELKNLKARLRYRRKKRGTTPRKVELKLNIKEVSLEDYPLFYQEMPFKVYSDHE